MLQATKRVILASLRRRGYEVLKASDPRLETRRVPVDVALASLSEHAVSEQQAGSRSPMSKVIKGVVPDSLRTSAPSTIAFLHVDMNSPGPEIAALDVLFDRISPGGVIILDDHGWILHRKQKDAADGFAATRGYDILELPTGQGLLIKR